MPVASAPSTSRRLLTLLSLLQGRRDWPACDLADRLDVSERTIRRDIDRLRELDYEIEATRGPAGGYRLGTGAHLPPLLLDDEQAVAVAISLRAAGMLGAGIEEAAERALATIGRTMPAHLARRTESLTFSTSARRSPGDAGASVATLLRIGQAVRNAEELRFDYAPTSSTGEEVQVRRRTNPHHLLLHGGRWYLIGFSADRDDWRVYRVDRMALRANNGDRFTPRQLPGGDPVTYLRARFRGSTETDTWPCWGEVVLRAPAEAVAPYIDDGTVEPLDQERCRVRIGAWSWRGLAATIGRFDADLEVIGPPELATAFLELARRFAGAGSRPLPAEDGIETRPASRGWEEGPTTPGATPRRAGGQE